MKSIFFWALCLTSIIIIALVSSLSFGQEKETKVSTVKVFKVTTVIPADYNVVPTLYKAHKEIRSQLIRPDNLCTTGCHQFKQVGEWKEEIAKPKKPKPKGEKDAFGGALVTLMMLGYFLAPLY